MANSEIQQQVDHLIDTRPGKELLQPNYEDVAYEVAPSIYRSNGATAAYMIVHDAGRIIVNTGMGYEAVHHKAVFDAICPGPTTHILTTQAHVDHVGGVGLFREPETIYIAQASNPACQQDDARIANLRYQGVWQDFEAAILDGTPLAADARYSLGEVATANAIVRSAQSRQWEKVW